MIRWIDHQIVVANGVIFVELHARIVSHRLAGGGLGTIPATEY
jgi:hypothetical protein